MPITGELKSINRLEQAGFTSEQAKAIVEVQEASIQRGFDRFVEVLDHNLKEFEARMRAELSSLRLEIADLRTETNTGMANLRTEMAALRADLMREQRDQMLRFAAIVSIVFAALSLALKFL